MKTLAVERDKAEVLQRLTRLRPDSPRRWGRMTAHQMVCHLSDSFRMSLGDVVASDATGPLQRTVVKWIALYSPLPWPSGIRTRPEVDQELGGTPPSDFSTDVAQLASLIDRVTVTPELSHRRAHPIFGTLTSRDWLRWGYLHTDHHLRQFGV